MIAGQESTVSRRRLLFVQIFIGMACAVSTLAGCEPRASSSEFRFLIGTVVSLNAETGELVIDAVRNDRQDRPTRCFCDITKDSEVYVNDLLQNYQAIQVGDRAELVVLPQVGAPMERFAVSYVHIRRGVPAAPVPNLPAMTLKAPPSGANTHE